MTKNFKKLKKYLPHIAILLAISAAIVLFISQRNNSKRRLNERVTFRKKDKIPYGMYVAYKNLKYLFPHASVYTNRNEPDYWDSISSNASDQALIIISPQFDADEFEMKRLISFIEKGNDVFISTAEVSDETKKMMRVKCSFPGISNFFSERIDLSDSFNVSLLHPPFEKNFSFTYPGLRYSAWFNETDSASTEMLGNEGKEFQRTNFIHLRAGNGNLFLHLAPMVFSNYFLLHKDNIRYYEHALSLINPNVTKVVWDEYYLLKKHTKMSRTNWLKVLFHYRSLAAALLIAIIALLMYVLLEMRRKQRYIPVITQPRNDSLDFVKTIGRLYFDKGDHLNLCKKMAAYFLEHIRNVYKLPTNNLNEEFIKALQFKTGRSENEISEIISSIKKLDGTQTISDKQLTLFHKQLESFYKTA